MTMSAVELAVSKVKGMSARQASALLEWLNSQQPNRTTLEPRPRISHRKTTALQRLKKLKEWESSVRGTTDWEPPRMPNDLVSSFRL
jgi:hypothetical protein